MTASKPWILKYAPKSTSEIVGREEEVAQLQNYISDFPKVSKRAVLLHGPAGSGKTSLVSAIAEELNYELFEINASDVRNKDQLQQKLMPAVQTKSFFYSGKIVLVDEMDGLSGTKDRGGIPELIRIIEKSSVPIILTANLVDAKKFKGLLKVCSVVDMMPLSLKVIGEVLRRIVVNEGVELTEDVESVIKKLALSCDGDARAAINDLQMVIVDGKVDPDRLELISTRKRTQDIEHALATVFKGRDVMAAREALGNVNEDVDTQFLWFDYNLPFEYTKPVDLARAYGVLTKADVFRARIRKNQEWRFLAYVFDLLSAGICTAKSEPYKSAPNYKQTTRLLRIWQINMSNAKRTAIAQKIALATHCSTREAFSQVEYYKIIFRAGVGEKGAMREDITTELGLDDAEVQWLCKV